MARISGADAIVQSLIANGVDTVFGLPGGQLDHLFDAVYRVGDKVRLLHSRHEQGAAYMAFGYAQTTGKEGVYTVVPGPGLLNTTAALSTAWACNSPVLAVSGQIPSAGIDSGYGHLHEIPDQLGLIRHLTKQAERIADPVATPAVVARAFSALRSGRPRPVEIEMPMDTMAETAEVGSPTVGKPEPHPAIDDDLITEAANALLDAKRPLIVVGSGALDAGSELLSRCGAIASAGNGETKRQGHRFGRSLPQPKPAGRPPSVGRSRCRARSGHAPKNAVD